MSRPLLSGSARVLLGLLLGAGIGLMLAQYDPAAAALVADAVQPIGRLWLNALQMTIVPLVVSLLVIIMFGGIIWGISPIQRGISWEGHLFGLLAGVGTAWLVAGINRKTKAGKL